MALLIFDLYAILLVGLDINLYKRQITPLTILVSVYTVLININNLIVSDLFGFYKVEDYVLCILILFYILIFLIDFLFAYVYRRSRLVSFNYSSRFQSYRVVTLLYFIGVGAYGLQFLRLFIIYGLNIKGMNNGMLGHLSSLAFILGPVSVDLAIKGKRKSRLFLSSLLYVLVVVISFLFGGKYVILINATYFLLYFCLKRENKLHISKMIKVLLVLVIGALTLFFFLYYLIPRVTGQYNSTLDFVIRHMFEYLMGPIVAQNTSMSNPGIGDTLIPFTVFINIGKALIRDKDYVSSIYEFVFPIRDGYSTNVSGILGESIYDLGFGFAFLYVGVVIFIINVITYLYRIGNKFYLTFCYLMCILAYCFFCNFLTVSGVVLPLILAFVLDFFSLYRIEKFHI